MTGPSLSTQNYSREIQERAIHTRICRALMEVAAFNPPFPLPLAESSDASFPLPLPAALLFLGAMSKGFCPGDACFLFLFLSGLSSDGCPACRQVELMFAVCAGGGVVALGRIVTWDCSAQFVVCASSLSTS